MKKSSRFNRSLEAQEWRRLYSTQKWRKGRAAYLRDHPLCQYCEHQGRTTAATVVDHVTPHKGDHDLFYDRANWQPLCAPHHDAAKAQEERGGWSNRTDAEGYPIDPNHPQNRSLVSGVSEPLRHGGGKRSSRKP
ncbi:HNH endonuclease [uncultured Brevundimonas sp.]|uniref:HNH endonuclease n=1 Tax=uncultured Brevundimonas sp. TaxID=213418 RepID=UPI00345BC278